MSNPLVGLALPIDPRNVNGDEAAAVASLPIGTRNVMADGTCRANAAMTDALHDCAGVSAHELSAVLNLVSGTDISELDITVGATRLSLRRPAILAASGAAADPPAAEPRSLAITSPLVGIFHASVSPGDDVHPGQSIGAVEALGMPTSVDAPQTGTVEELLVGDGSPVEYGQPLLILRRAVLAASGDA